jgi:hypothetical protein
LNFNFDWSKDYMDIREYFGEYSDYY